MTDWNLCTDLYILQLVKSGLFPNLVRPKLKLGLGLDFGARNQLLDSIVDETGNILAKGSGATAFLPILPPLDPYT